MTRCEDDRSGVVGCGKSWSGTRPAHCTECHHTFSSNSVAAECHDYYPTRLVCHEPSSCGLELTEWGIWVRPADGPRVPVSVGQTADSQVLGRGVAAGEAA